jgi:hypothetical protein
MWYVSQSGGAYPRRERRGIVPVKPISDILSVYQLQKERISTENAGENSLKSPKRP